jgi:hypothetical protein
MPKKRPDFSMYVAHFTSDRISVNGIKNPANEYKEISAYERLLNILELKKITASEMPWTHSRAVCFTECPWTSLLLHTEEYSTYAIGFSKAAVFSKHGSPALYVRPDQYEKQKWHDHIMPFVTPFWPAYHPKNCDKANFKVCDFSHEREWRTPHDFPFEYDQIEFIILGTYEDMAKFPREYKDTIGREKFILMDNYRKVEMLWPVHRID